MNRINLVCLGVSDISRSLKFYRSLGFECSEKKENPPIVFFNNSGSKLELFPLNELAKDINQDISPTISKNTFSGITLAINMKSKQEVDDLIQLVQSVGGKIIKEPVLVDWGGYSGYFTDLDGYYWEVAYSKDWRFDNNDMLIID